MLTIDGKQHNYFALNLIQTPVSLARSGNAAAAARL